MHTQSHYVIEVSLKGRPLFKIDDETIADELRAMFIYQQVSQRFPKSEGFDHVCTFWGCSATPIHFQR